MYHDKLLVSVHTMPSPVTALWFGRYGREDNALVTITKSGMLDIKARQGVDRLHLCSWSGHMSS